MTQKKAQETSANFPFLSQGRIRRIGLLSPTSGNLGNATMQSAMIANLRKRIPDVEFIGVTLNPEETSRRHGIEGFPIAAVSRPYYGLLGGFASNGQRRPARGARVKRCLKRIPVLGAALRTIRTWGKEFAHIRAAARLVSGLDRVIIPGGGALDDFWGGPWGHPWSLFKFAVLCRVYCVPFLFVSVGKCSLDRHLSRLLARAALKLASYRSYRDSNSKLAIQSLLDAYNDPVYPDLAFSYPSPSLRDPLDRGAEDSLLTIGISPIAHCDPRVWPRRDARRYAPYLRDLAKFVTWLVQQHHRLLFFTTDGADSATLHDLRALVASSNPNARVLPEPAELSPGALLRGIFPADLTVASRLHGVILSHLNATPVLALSFDPKVDAHMMAAGQQKFCLPIDGLQLDLMIDRFNTLKARCGQESAHLRRVAQAWRQDLDRQYDRIVGLDSARGYRPNQIGDPEGSPIGVPGTAWEREEVGGRHAQ